MREAILPMMMALLMLPAAAQQRNFLTPAEADQSIARLRNAERGKSLYDQIDFRTGAITKLRR